MSGAVQVAATPLRLLEAAEGGAVLAELGVVALRAQGADAASFLHGQVANDVTGLPVGGANLTLALNHRGHALAEASVLREAKDSFLLAIEPEGADWLIDSLEGHIIFDQVTLERLPDLRLLTLQGAGAGALLAEAPADGAYAPLEPGGVSVTAFRRSRSAQGGFDLLVEAAQVASLREALEAAGAVPATADVIDALRVRGGVPSAAKEGGAGVLPQEAGLESALSYRKGCYLGQEIMARIEARGNLRRSLARLDLSGAPAFDDDARPVTSGGRRVGRIGTVVTVEGGVDGAPAFEALAVLRNDLPADSELEAGGVTARLVDLVD